MKTTVFFLIGVLLCSPVKTYAQDDLLDLGVEEDLKTESPQKVSNASASKTKTSKFTSVLGDTFNLFGNKQNKKEETAVSPEELEKKAQQGDVQAQLDLGYAYLYGVNGVKTDYEKAFSYYKAAAGKKNPVALNNLGSLYFNGIGTTKDYSAAIKYFDEAAKLGSNDAAVNLAIIYLGSDPKTKTRADFEKIYSLLNQAKSTNNTAKFLLGYAYYEGFLVNTDIKQAFKLIKEAADEQYDEAQYILSDFYINGWGTTKNYSRAVQYLQDAANQGNADAMVKLADIYAAGKIYTRNIKKAHILYNTASVLGKDEAAKKRNELEKMLKIEDLLDIQSEAENYQPAPSQLTSFVRQTYGNSLKAYIDINLESEYAKPLD